MWAQRGDALYFVAGSAIMSRTSRRSRNCAPVFHAVIVNDPLLVQGGAASKPFDVAPDGRILAIKEDDSIRSDHIVVVQNWLQVGRGHPARR